MKAYVEEILYNYLYFIYNNYNKINKFSKYKINKSNNYMILESYNNIILPLLANFDFERLKLVGKPALILSENNIDSLWIYRKVYENKYTIFLNYKYNDNIFDILNNKVKKDKKLYYGEGYNKSIENNDFINNYDLELLIENIKKFTYHPYFNHYDIIKKAKIDNKNKFYILKYEYAFDIYIKGEKDKTYNIILNKEEKDLTYVETIFLNWLDLNYYLKSIKKENNKK